MKHISLGLLMLLIMLTACSSASSVRVPTDQLPDPAIYALTPDELPEVGSSWQETYNQTTEQQGDKWSYHAYQAYQPGTSTTEPDYAYAVNNDVYLYETDMRRADLPQPPDSLGNIQGVSWQAATQLHKVGDKSAVWKTTLGDMLTPVWWLEFYKGHAYVRISLLGFPDQVAPAIIYGLADIVEERLPDTIDQLRSDVGKPAIAQAQLVATAIPEVSTPTSIPFSEPDNYVTIPIQSYTAPPGETGMVTFADETGLQLSDGALGSDDILSDLGNGAGYEWVGWTDLTEPVTLTFTLSDASPVAAVKIGTYHREGLGIFVPLQVTINGQSFELDADAIPNNQRGELTFSGPFAGPQVTVVLNHRGRGWIMLDEVSFLADN
jgi:hypothetical protein